MLLGRWEPLKLVLINELWDVLEKYRDYFLVLIDIALIRK